MTKIVEGLGGRLAPAQTAAGNELINQVGRSDRKLREKLGTIKEEGQAFKNRGIAVPELEQHRAMLAVCRVKLPERSESHQMRQPLLSPALRGNGVGLQVALHLETVFEITKKNISFGKSRSILVRQPLVLH